MSNTDLPLNQILEGDCIELMDKLPDQSVDLIFADPPYNLQLQHELWRPNMTHVEGVIEDWDQFASFDDYDNFSKKWLEASRRVLKDTGTIWVIGSYHNIFRIGMMMQNLGFWLLNDIVWIKTNPMPNFRGVRFTNAHETLIWAAKIKTGRYTFNHHAMKSLNDDLQMRSDWILPICSGAERLKRDGKKAHPTQKPEALLYRVILASSKPGDVILDPFFGTGTTGAVAKKLHRNWIGIERETNYIAIARQRLENVTPELFASTSLDIGFSKRGETRIPFGSLLENGLLLPGQALYFRRDRKQLATIRADGNLAYDGQVGSIHRLGTYLMDGSPCNGWSHWYYEADDGNLHAIDELRQMLRTQVMPVENENSLISHLT